MNEILKINIIELSCNLADKKILDSLPIELENGLILTKEEDLYIENNNEITYIEDIQDIFNKLFDEYYNFIKKYEINN